MAGVPELNGVFGTFGGMSGLNIEPVLARQRGRMFAQQLAQEAARMAQQKELATRELDLRERGQDLGTQENELARQFAMNLQKFKQDFDAAEAEKQRKASVEAQQRSIGSAEKMQGISIQGQRDLQKSDIDFRRGEGEADRALRREGMAIQQQQFADSLGFDREKFDFGKTVELRNQDRADRAEELQQQLADVDMQYKRGLISQQQAQTKLVETQVEMLSHQLAEAREDAGLSDEDVQAIMGAAAEGDAGALGEKLSAKLLNNKKARDAVFGIIDLVKSAQEIGIVKKATEEKEKAADEAAAPADTPEVAELRRKQAEGSLGSAGEARIGVFDKLAEISDDDSDPANKRREELNLILEMLKQYPDTEDIPGDLSIDKGDWLALIPPALGMKRGAQVVNRIFKEFGVGEGANLRELLDKYDIEP